MISTRRYNASAARRCRFPYAKHLEEAALPQVPAIVAAVKRTLGG